MPVGPKSTVVIVESPAKCKKIEEYLGPGYKCLASYGHLRTILSLKDIDIANNFKPTYTIIDNSIISYRYALFLVAPITTNKFNEPNVPMVFLLGVRQSFQ